MTEHFNATRLRSAAISEWGIKDVVTLKEDAAGCTGDVNYYQIADENLLFISEESYNYHFVPLEDGASFTWTSDIK